MQQPRTNVTVGVLDAPDPTPSLRLAPPPITVSLVIPAMNEARNIGWVLERLPAMIDEIILVDGDSVDDTIEVSRAICPDIRVIGQDRPGKGAALRFGFAAARGEIVVMIDADGSMDPAEIERFLELLDDGYDLVKARASSPTAARPTWSACGAGATALCAGWSTVSMAPQRPASARAGAEPRESHWS